MLFSKKNDKEKPKDSNNRQNIEGERFRFLNEKDIEFLNRAGVSESKIKRVLLQIKTKGENRGKKDFVFKDSGYERLCRFCSRIFPKSTKNPKIEEDILVARMSVSSSQVFSATIFTGALFFILSALFFLFDRFLGLLVLILGVVFTNYIYSYPRVRREIYKIQASDTAIVALLYLVIYLRLNPNLDSAYVFAAKYLTGPLGDDFKRLIWSLESGIHSTLREAVSTFSYVWNKWNLDFTRALELLFDVERQNTDAEIEETLKQSLDLLLSSTSSNMKTYSLALEMPSQILQMMGILLPLLVLILFSVLSIFLSSSVKAYHLMFGYWVFLPIILTFYMYNLLIKKPGGVARSELKDAQIISAPGKFKFRGEDIDIWPIALGAGLLISLPGIFYLFRVLFFEIKPEDALSFADFFWSLFLVLGLGIGVYIYTYLNSAGKMKTVFGVSDIEEEFSTALYQLSTILRQGMPLENAIVVLIDAYERVKLGGEQVKDFFLIVSKNLRELNMDLSDAVLDPKVGAISKYPSKLIRDISLIILEGAKKGSRTLSGATNTIARFLDLLSETKKSIVQLLSSVLSQIKFQIKILAPLVAVTVVAFSRFVLGVLVKISGILSEFSGQLGFSTSGVDVSSLSLVDINNALPAPVFQIIVGVYLVVTVVILASFVDGIENGINYISRSWAISRMVLPITLIYVAISALVYLIVGAFSESILGGTI